MWRWRLHQHQHQHHLVEQVETETVRGSDSGVVLQWWSRLQILMSADPKEVLSEVLCHSWACLYYKISLSSSASLSKAYSPGLLKVAWLLRLTQMFGLQGWKLGWRSGKEIPLWAAVGRRVSIECGRRKEQKTGVNCSKNTEEKRWKKIHQNGFSVDSCVQPRWIWNQTCIYSTFKMKLFLFFILNGLNWN